MKDNEVRNRKYRSKLIKRLINKTKLIKLDRIPISACERIKNPDQTFEDAVNLINFTRLLPPYSVIPENSNKIIDYLRENATDTEPFPFINEESNTFLKTIITFQKIIALNLSFLEIPNIRFLKKATGLKEMIALDLSRNKIDCNLNDIIEIISRFPNLRMLYISDNAIMEREPKCKVPIDIKNMFSNNEINRFLIINELPQLEIVDDCITEDDVSIAEAIAANEKNSLIRIFDIPDELKDQVRVINISNLNLSKYNFEEYSQLSFLDISGNLFDDNFNIDLSKIFYLDISRNNFTDIDKLATMALSKNLYHFNCTLQKSKSGNDVQIISRKDFLSLIFEKIASKDLPLEKRFAEIFYNFPIKVLDNKIVTFGEVVEALNAKVDDFSKYLAMKYMKKMNQLDCYVKLKESQEFPFHGLSCEHEQKNMHRLYLDNCYLSHFSGFNENDIEVYITIKELIISNNDLKSEDLSQICVNTEFIKRVDLSHNQIDDVKAIANFLIQFPVLKHIVIEDNPAFPKADEYEALFEEAPSLYSRIHTVNGISVERRQSNDLTMILKETTITKSINLSGEGIEDISALSDFGAQADWWVGYLDLSNNKIKKLPKDTLRYLGTIVNLNISNNEIESADEIVNFLQYYPKINSINVENALHDNSDPTDILIQKCPYLLWINGKSVGQGKEFFDFDRSLIQLRMLTKVVTIPTKVDLSEVETRFSMKELDLIVKCLHSLGVIELWTPKIVETIPHGNDLFVKKLSMTLKKINGAEIDQARIMQATCCPYNCFADIISKSDKESKAMKLIAAAVGYVSGLDHENIIEDIEDYKEKAEKGAKHALKFGSFIAKTEIFITFQQILMQVINFIERIKWPKIYLDFSWLAWIFTIDLSFLNFFLDIKIPTYLSYISFFLYSLGPMIALLAYRWATLRKVRHITASLRYNWCYSYNEIKSININRGYVLSVVALVLALICSWGIAFLFDFNSILYHKKLTNNALAWGLSLSGVSIIIFIIWIILLVVFNKKYYPNIYIDVEKWIMKIALFFIMLLYSPSIQFFVNVLTCDESETHSAAFDDLSCWKNWDTFTFVHLMALVIGIVYAIWIPVFGIVEIVKGVKSLDKMFNFDQDLERIDMEKKILKEAKKGQFENVSAVGLMIDKEEKTEKEIVADLKNIIKEDEEKYQTDFQTASSGFAHPSGYLFSQFKRKDRFKKIIDLIKKIVTMILTAFVASPIFKNVVASVMFFALSVYQLIEKPLTVVVENILETAAQIANFISLGIGEILEFEWIENPIFKQLIAPIILIALIIIILIVYLVLALKYHCCYQCHTAEKVGADECNEEEEEDCDESLKELMRQKEENCESNDELPNDLNEISDCESEKEVETTKRSQIDDKLIDDDDYEIDSDEVI